MENIEKIKKTLMISIFEVFEKMFYIFLEPVGKRSEGHEFTACINFSSTADGSIGVMFSRSLAEAMAQNMLNIEASEVTEKLMEDCLKEAVNMICGNFLRKYDSSKVFDLSLPAVAACSEAKAAHLPSSSKNMWELNFASGEGAMGVDITFPISEDVGGSLGRKIVFNTVKNEAIGYKVSTLRSNDWYPYTPTEDRER